MTPRCDVIGCKNPSVHVVFPFRSRQLAISDRPAAAERFMVDPETGKLGLKAHLCVEHFKEMGS